MSDKTVPLFNPNDGVTGRDGGPYLDQVQAVEAEKVRAKIEGRSPDLDNPPAHAGIPLNTAGQQAFTVGVNSNPSQANRNYTDDDSQFDAAVKSNDNLLHAVSTREQIVDAGAGPVFGQSNLSDLNPAAIATGPSADGEHTAGKASKEVQKNTGADTSAPKTRKSTPRKRAAKKATPARKTSAASVSSKKEVK